MAEERATMTIGEVAEASGATPYTLRYYERVGLIPMVERTDAGHRRYREGHVDWIRFLGRLRASGMSIQKMRAYAQLVAQGRDNLPERRRLLRRHLEDIEERKEELRAAERLLHSKLDFYDRLEEDEDAVWTFPD